MTKNTLLQWCCTSCNHRDLTVGLSLIICPHCQTQYFLKKEIWECADGFIPADFTTNRSEHLLDIEQQHFWFDARNALLRRKLLSLKRPEDQQLLELGCGSGRMLATIEGNFSLSAGIEGHWGALNKAVEICSDSQLLHGNVLNTPLTDDQFDWVVAFDVLEHVEAKTFLGEAFRLARPGGKLLLSVPAFPLLWSRMDELAGHRCRYRLQPLREELLAAGWRINGHTYFQFLLFFLLAASRRIHRRKPSSLERKPPSVINKILGYINSFEVTLFHRFSLPFGSSLIVWAEKPKNPSIKA